MALTARAEAQVCHGTLPFGPDRHVNVNVGASASEGPTLKSGRSGILNVDFGTGDDFIRTSVQRNRYSDYGYTTTEVDAAVGRALEVLPRSKLTLCPEAELVVTYRIPVGLKFGLTSTTLLVGIAF